MKNPIDRIELLDLTLFDSIQSQTSAGDRSSLLAIQRAVAKKNKEYTYLEIGSHLGGSIQPHLIDDRCKRIYSIDPRPLQQPDDRSHGHVEYYDDNSSEKMIALLRNISGGDVDKIDCIELNASEIDPKKIENRPELAFIDGEHSKAAVLSDFLFCDEVVSERGTILFHDFFIIFPALFEICRILDRQHRTYLPLMLENELFGIFFDHDLVHSDPYLTVLFKKNRYFWLGFRYKAWLKQILPGSIVRGIRAVRSLVKKKTQRC
jgi:hypothetical protein